MAEAERWLRPTARGDALATLEVYEQDRLIDRARQRGVLMRELLQGLERKHAIVGATRNIGLFGIVELVKNRETREPLAPFNGTSEMVLEVMTSPMELDSVCTADADALTSTRDDDPLTKSLTSARAR